MRVDIEAFLSNEAFQAFKLIKTVHLFEKMKVLMKYSTACTAQSNLRVRKAIKICTLNPTLKDISDLINNFIRKILKKTIGDLFKKSLDENF